MLCRHKSSLSNVEKIIADGGYTGDKFANQVTEILPSAKVEVIKRNEVGKFKVLPKRWVIERSFSWLEKCRRLWKNCERHIKTSGSGSYGSDSSIIEDDKPIDYLLVPPPNFRKGKCFSNYTSHTLS